MSATKDPSKKDSATALLLSTLPVGLPPVLPDINHELDQFLRSPEHLDIHSSEHSCRWLPRQTSIEACYSIDVTPLQTELVVDRDESTGQLLGFREECLQDAGKSCKNSTSLTRLPGPASDGVCGSSTNYPFWPGGLDEPNISVLKSNVTDSTSLDFEKELLTVPPGFKHGATFERRNVDGIMKCTSPPSKIVLSDILGQGYDLDFLVGSGVDDEQCKVTHQSVVVDDVSVGGEIVDSLTELKQVPEKILQPALPQQDVQEWAVIVDGINTPVSRFSERVPDMAYKFPFKLDTFQKQAIIHLENHESVFVAAHTSAGKTVIAQYAIALSILHMTKAVYTSPIKALSNQKFRDFREEFPSVGLVTGDVQIKPDADCLIMTTEILRSMLYNGSEVVRDLEWVIFDEVHYINDTERGVVWEEVLIMLPAHVNIVMLSATVPNTKEFGEWVGRTKHKKVYVVSTPKRPVPLEHYLYTGNSSKTINEVFLILDAEKNFLTAGYKKAVEAKKERSSKVSQSFGAKGTRYNVTPQQDKNIWLSVIEMLKKRDKMPAVAFLFSRKRIEELTNQLRSIDLIESKEDRQHIHTFFEQCVSRLKGSDRKLPQVMQIRDLLHRGIGIHHSGILPILKEVVEMLFQKSYVKILFATETFAMGVNMPARTVIFDTMQKYDGSAFRDLLSGEYIQMAGRAGRRGIDDTGTVILLCKGDVPEMSDLNKMMLGRVTTLESQFRLTYSMILNLLRVEQLRVEDMIKRSFGEFHTQKDASAYAEKLKVLESRLDDLPIVSDPSGDLQQYYDCCTEYFKLRSSINSIYSQHVGSKVLTPGRVVVLDTKDHHNAAAVVLLNKDNNIKVLVLSGRNSLLSTDDEDWGVLPRPVIGNKLFFPEGHCSQVVASISVDDIAVVSVKVLKVNAERIIDDVKKREQPRFRNDPPGQSTQLATQELLRLVESNPDGLLAVDPVADLRIQDLDLVQDVRRFQYLAKSLPTFSCIHDPMFDDNFRRLRENTATRNEHHRLKMMLSDDSLALLPEYQQRVKVLRSLGYINEDGVVQLKGRVACELSTVADHELLLTELIFDNAFANMQPAEVASLLSCFVFQVARCSEPTLTAQLLKCQQRFVSKAGEVGQLQHDCGIAIAVEDYVESLHFGLMEVVHEWARGTSFAKITELTDVQEGLIVRCIQRLDETLRDVRKAAHIVGDPVLERKAVDASAAIKRDIVFAASLYTLTD